MKIITVVEVNDVAHYPPVQSLLRILLQEGYAVKLIGSNLSNLEPDILQAPHYTGYELPPKKSKTLFQRAKYRIDVHRLVNRWVKECMQDADYLWTTSMFSMRALGKNALKYKNVLQLMELARYGYSFRRIVRFPIGKYARLSWKTVVPEINRAYIQKVWWDLPRTPYVLPNKPYSIDYGSVTPEMEKAIQRMEREKKKIILYLGGIGPDREFGTVADAITKTEEYILYIVGNFFSPEGEKKLQDLKKKGSVVYLGGFISPKHLAMVKNAYIGLLPYRPQKGSASSELNALYCAPNKIFEYAGFGVPMIGTDVLGLRLPFEKWDIGRCFDLNNEESIINAITEVSARHDEMSANCYNFYNSVDLRQIINSILQED